jgi:hypothetical protein
MNTRKSIGSATAVLIATSVGLGCMTSQTAAFRRMSAAQHEAAAQGVAGSSEDANEHLAAARELRQTEGAACVDVSDADRERGPFGHREWLAGVEIVRDRYRFAKGPAEPAGVAVYLRAEPGITEQWIGRLIQCHLAHHAVVGEGVAQESCPLSLDGTRIDLTSTHTGFRVAITTKDIATARSLIDRCQSLVN